MYEDSHTRMAKVEWADAIKTVSGALTKINKKSPHAQDQKMILANHRKAETTTENGCNRLYIRGLSAVTRSTQPSTDETMARLRFGTVGAAVAVRAKSLEHMATDQANFIAQKDQPNGKKTFKSYLWSLELAEYDRQHPNG